MAQEARGVVVKAGTRAHRQGSRYYMGYETGRAGDAADPRSVNQIIVFESRQRNREGEGERARAALRSPTSVCVCATDRFDRGRSG